MKQTLKIFLILFTLLSAPIFRGYAYWGLDTSEFDEAYRKREEAQKRAREKQRQEDARWTRWTPKTLNLPPWTFFVCNPDSILSSVERDVVEEMLRTLLAEREVHGYVVCVGYILPEDSLTLRRSLTKELDINDNGFVLLLSTKKSTASIWMGESFSPLLEQNVTNDLLKPFLAQSKDNYGEKVVHLVDDITKYLKRELSIPEKQIEGPITEFYEPDYTTPIIARTLVILVILIIIILLFVILRRKAKRHKRSVLTPQKPVSHIVPTKDTEVTCVIKSSFLQNGRYKLGDIIGQGGFGITYIGEQTSLGRKVAIKEFFMKDFCRRDESTSEVTIGTGANKEVVEKCKAKFLKEARTIAGLDNPHIVHVIDVFEENGTAYYVMDYIEGKNLKALGQIPEKQALSYIKQIADALKYLHSKNILHLDVKPANILIKQDGTAVLIDFGISKGYDNQGEQTTSTPAGRSKGYAPLEQYSQDLAKFTPATDIYSLGATLFYSLTGTVPPEATMLIQEDFPSKPANVNDCTWQAISSAMQPKVSKRPQNIDSFLAMLNV